MAQIPLPQVQSVELGEGRSSFVMEYGGRAVVGLIVPEAAGRAIDWIRRDGPDRPGRSEFLACPTDPAVADVLRDLIHWVLTGEDNLSRENSPS
jgi:hypothetical protein